MSDCQHCVPGRTCPGCTARKIKALPAAPVERGEPDKVREADAAVQEAKQELETAAQFGDAYATVTVETLRDLLALRAAPSGEAEDVLRELAAIVMDGDAPDYCNVVQDDPIANAYVRLASAVMAAVEHATHPAAPQDGPQVTDLSDDEAEEIARANIPERVGDWDNLSQLERDVSITFVKAGHRAALTPQPKEARDG